MLGIDLKKLLQGRYEAERFPKDFTRESSVPDFAFNVLNQTGLLHRPIVDEWRIQQGMEKPKWPDGRSFAVCLTHDVDKVSSHSIVPAFRRKQIQWKNRNDPDKQDIGIYGGRIQSVSCCQAGHQKRPSFLF